MVYRKGIRVSIEHGKGRIDTIITGHFYVRGRLYYTTKATKLSGIPASGVIRKSK